MTKWALYHDFDPFKCEVIREAIKAKAIADGEVICGDIKELDARQLLGFTQCHFFAGGGFWSLALREAGWPDERPVWTGSCPCPSFSAAGKGQGFADPRHLWPVWYRLIGECRPASLFGEQVAAAIGHGWLDLVCADLEAEGYAIAAAVLGAHSAGAPHIRQRLYFVAESNTAGSQVRRAETSRGMGERIAGGPPSSAVGAAPTKSGVDERLGQPRRTGLEGYPRHGDDGDESRWDGEEPAGSVAEAGESGGMADTGSERRQQNPRGSPSNEATHGREGWNWSESHGDHEPPSYGANGYVGEPGSVADLCSLGREWREGTAQRDERDGPDARRFEGDGGPECGGKDAGGLADATSAGGWQQPERGGRETNESGRQIDDGRSASSSDEPPGGGEAVRSSPLNGFWGDADWIGCRDGKFRPVEPGTFPLAHGSPARVGRLRMYGDAINVETARLFIESYLEARDDGTDL